MRHHVLFFLTGLMVLPLQAHAGFGYGENSDDGKAITITNDPNVSMDGVPVPEEGAKRPESDPDAPSLQIFNERYVPDTVRKKYGINENWYEQGQPQDSNLQDSNLQPADMSAEPSVEGDEFSRARPVPRPDTGAYDPQVGLEHEIRSAEDHLQPPPNNDVQDPLPEPQPDGQGNLRKPLEMPPETAANTPVQEPILDEQAVEATAPVRDIQPEKVSYAGVQSWRARKGESVRDVLKRWSNRENVDLLWASGTYPVLEKDFSYFGDLQGAVTNLTQATGGSLYSQYRSGGLDPVMSSPAATIKSEIEVPKPEPKFALPNPLRPPEPVKKDRRLETRWFALNGASLRDVLQVWAEDAHVTLVWQADSGFALRDSVSQVGYFEDAVYKALQQFDNDPVRPVGQLYNDPSTGSKVLLIKTENNS